jgi:hypothetical protein
MGGKIKNTEELKKYLNDSSIVCPMPMKWNELYNMLKNKTSINGKLEPSLPLILAAWYDTPYLAKILRFHEHLDWAEKENQAKEVIDYLLSLKDDEWLHL